MKREKVKEESGVESLLLGEDIIIAMGLLDMQRLARSQANIQEEEKGEAVLSVWTEKTHRKEGVGWGRRWGFY